MTSILNMKILTGIQVDERRNLKVQKFEGALCEMHTSWGREKGKTEVLLVIEEEKNQNGGNFGFWKRAQSWRSHNL